MDKRALNDAQEPQRAQSEYFNALKLCDFGKTRCSVPAAEARADLEALLAEQQASSTTGSGGATELLDGPSNYSSKILMPERNNPIQVLPPVSAEERARIRRALEQLNSLRLDENYGRVVLLGENGGSPRYMAPECFVVDT